MVLVVVVSKMIAIFFILSSSTTVLYSTPEQRGNPSAPKIELKHPVVGAIRAMSARDFVFACLRRQKFLLPHHQTERRAPGHPSAKGGLPRIRRQGAAFRHCAD